MNPKEVRKQNRLEKFESNHPFCVVCNESDDRCLERHHISGKAYGENLAIVCRNCHRKLSDDQIDHPKKLSKEPIQSESIGHFLLGLADLFALIVERLKVFGHALIESAKKD